MANFTTNYNIKKPVSTEYFDLADLNANMDIIDAKLKQALDSIFPSGSIMYVHSTTAPTGFLKCNGSAVSRTTYANLFSVIGTTYGAGDGSTTFNLPDLRGEFIRGWDDSRGVDSGRALGSTQTDDTKPHTHTGSTSTAGSHVHNMGSNTSSQYASALNSTVSPTSGTTTAPAGDHTHTVTINANTGTETRPRNVALLACIKY